MPSVTREFKEALAKQGKKYCHSCDEVYFPPHPEHDEHEQERAEKRQRAGLDPNGEGFDGLDLKRFLRHSGLHG